MPCLIIGRHAQLPREVLVVCKQITGTLLLNNVREELKVRVNLQGNQTVSPSEFEAAAGCSKGKNWKVWPDRNLRCIPAILPLSSLLNNEKDTGKGCQEGTQNLPLF